MPLTIRRRLVDRIRQRRKIAYTVCAGLVVLAGAVVFLSVSTPAGSVELASDSSFFDPERAMRVAEDMLLFPQRTIGSQDAAGATAWLAEKFDRLGIPSEMVETDAFTATLGDEEVTLRNVTIVLQGASEETIIVTAPRDVSTIVKVDPVAYTSATAVLVDLVQVFAARPHQKTLVFLSTEDGNSGGLGISRFLDVYESTEDVAAILTIQGLGKETGPLSSGRRDSTPEHDPGVVRATHRPHPGEGRPGPASTGDADPSRRPCPRFVARRSSGRPEPGNRLSHDL